MDLLSPQSQALLSLRQALTDAANDNAFQSSAERMKSLQDCYWRLAVLSYAAILYRGGTVLPGELLTQADDFGIIVKDDTERTLRTEAFMLTSDEEKFFRYFLDFGNRLSVLRRHLKMAGEPEIFTEGIRRAQREDRIGMSLQRIQFFGYFSGRGLKVISLMWLVCLTFGLLILMALDKIPESVLGYLVAIPMAIGFLAIGTTLSLGLRAMHSRE
jgi:hypothetical protein